jgi:hypothetical protein
MGADVGFSINALYVQGPILELRIIFCNTQKWVHLCMDSEVWSELRTWMEFRFVWSRPADDGEDGSPKRAT